MVFRKLALIAMMAGVSGTALAQYENTTIDERIAATNNNNEDSIKVGRGYISLFQQSISNQSWADAYINWKWLMAHAPYAVHGI